MVTVQWAGDVGGPIRLRPGTLLWHDGMCVDYPEGSPVVGEPRPGNFKAMYDEMAKALLAGTVVKIL